MSHITRLTSQECTDRGAKALAPYSDKPPFEAIKVYGVPRGGSCALLHLLSDPSFPFRISPVCSPGMADVILDDIIDSGKTRGRYTGATGPKIFESMSGEKEIIDWTRNPRPFVALVDKTNGDAGIGWVVFPWEKETGPEDAVVRLIEGVGENPLREGLLETPKRVVKALREMTEGYQQSAEQILSTVFTEEGCDEIVLLRGISFVSMCEHHLLPFIGTADVGYLPQQGKVVGLSKLARLVDCFSRRLQLQERLTMQIGNALMTYLKAKGAAVVIRAQHSCMGCRGVRKQGAEMVTSAMLGVFREDPKARSEFMALLGT